MKELWILFRYLAPNGLKSLQSKPLKARFFVSLICKSYFVSMSPKLLFILSSGFLLTNNNSIRTFNVPVFRQA